MGSWESQPAVAAADPPRRVCETRLLPQCLHSPVKYVATMNMAVQRCTDCTPLLKEVGVLHSAALAGAKASLPIGDVRPYAGRSDRVV